MQRAKRGGASLEAAPAFENMEDEFEADVDLGGPTPPGGDGDVGREFCRADDFGGHSMA